jgi:uncharacterized protein YdeI (YjbR/CyaY-like superfamily)
LPALFSLNLSSSQNIYIRTFFQSQAPSYQKIAIHWVMNAKQETTKINRLEKLIAASEAQQKV